MRRRRRGGFGLADDDRVRGSRGGAPADLRDAGRRGGGPPTFPSRRRSPGTGSGFWVGA
ncbi:hypothetical protein QSJ19_17795 [Gordonia sp. ABSL11-1]|uniref:hypothetical protein n=1 Tax=Gordonia sp. ABSL11-1 TaxID=3053924 RepID=UPI0025733F44|nr:hypothetical protein [Gordonia sp. ABSL11-1]MDL9947400.1 hypothetical protein [Gordonia sp. ABSL11-1]